MSMRTIYVDLHRNIKFANIHENLRLAGRYFYF